MTLTKIASTGVEDSLRWVLGANGTSDYTFTGPGLTGTVNDPTIYLTRGHTYIFQNNSGGHPFYIKTSIANGGTNDAYNTGVTNNGGGNGTEIVFTVPHDSPDILYYQCSSHASMAGQFNIAGSVADGSITTAKLADDAVNNDKLANSVVAAIAANTAKTSNATHTGDVTGSTALTIANDAVTSAKIADNAVTSARIGGGAVTETKLGTSSVTTAKIADEAVTLAKLEHGTSSNDGKFLRANNGADPTFETVTTTNVNGNVDHRVITATGTAQQVQGESGLTYDGSNLNVTGGLNVSSDVSIADTIKHTGDTNTKIRFPAADNIGMEVNGSEILRITPDGVFGSEPNIRLKASTTIDHAAVQVGGSKDYSSGIPRNQLGVSDAQSYDTDFNGGAIAFHAKYHANGAYTTMGSVEGIKANNSSGNYEGALLFRTRAHNGSNNIGLRLTNHGLCFGSDTADVNALDDYEEGNHTFTNSQGVSMTSNRGYYIKIGSYVFVSGSVNVGSNSQGSTLTLSLPFNSNINSYFAGGGYITYTNIDSTYRTNMMVSVENSGSNMHFRYEGGSNLGASAFSNRRIDFSVHYQRT